MAGEVMEVERSTRAGAAGPAPRRGRQWAPRIWQGLDFVAWVRLAAKNRLALSFSHSYMAAVITVVSLGHTLLKWVERAWYGRRVARAEIREAPIFIIGHWRTGTTLLHELLALDDRHTYPNTYQCLEPNHFLLTEWFFRRWPSFLMPARRPMDNMEASWSAPQEDEFALCMMGLPSPYLKIAFPNRPEPYPASTDLIGLSPRQLDRWRRGFVGFLRRLTFARPGRLILKSPTHSCRIDTILGLFPDARFVHIVRDPRVVFPSTRHLWKSLWKAHGLQSPTCEGLDEYVYENFLHLYGRIEECRPLVNRSRFFELRYEDLVAEPIESMRALYDQLDLGGFDEVLPALEARVADFASYRTNRYEQPPGERAEVERRWGEVIRRYGYDA